MPKIVAKLKAGGQRLTITGPRAVPADPGRAGQDPRLRPEARGAERRHGGRRQPAATAGGAGSRLGGAGGQGAAPGGGGFGFSRGAFAKCLPPQFRNFRRTITTPQQTIQQIVNPPQTNIKSSSYTIAGVDPSQPGIGLVTPSLLSKRPLPLAGRRATRRSSPTPTRAATGLKVGSKLDLNKTTFNVVGLVKPPLGGQTADVYIPLKQLQSLASEKALANVILVRAASGTSVGAVQSQIQSSTRTRRWRAPRTWPTRSAARS